MVPYSHTLPRMTELDPYQPSGFYQALSDVLARGEAAFVAFVVDHTRGSPGTRGAKWFVTARGDPVGTIGGGIMEHRLTARAREALIGGEMAPALQTLHHRKDAPGDPSGMICAGRQTNLYCLATPADHAGLFADAARLAAASLRGRLTICPEGIALADDPPDLSRPAIQWLEESSNHWNYIEELANRRRAAIIGGGHCGRSLSRALRHVGYLVTVFDRRGDVETFRENPYAHHRVRVRDYRDAGPLIVLPETTRVVVMTSDFPSDVDALKGVFDTPAPYIGVMGSKAKIARIREELLADGRSGEALDRLRAPIGLPIGSNTPDEIAVSIAAELIAEENRGRGVIRVRSRNG